MKASRNATTRREALRSQNTEKAGYDEKTAKETETAQQRETTHSIAGKKGKKLPPRQCQQLSSSRKGACLLLAEARLLCVGMSKENGAVRRRQGVTEW